ncbi:MAG: DNA recombination protein RmuC [Azoarcus sp.]|jgi:DNA recombination protein RmuC|nr:DNA recombination protein RmuC [Azoarcus sp.]
MNELLQSPLVFAALGLLSGIVVLLLWLAVSSGMRERHLLKHLDEALDRNALDHHREILRDLHAGLDRQTDRIGDHARADRELLQSGLTAASMQLSRSIEALTQGVEGQLRTLSGQINTRLDEGLRKTGDTFASVMARLATIDEAQKRIDGLSASVLSLQELLGDKRSRGAFGEVQLEALVRNALPPDVCAFQVSLPNGTRVDCLLELPPPTGRVAIDAKFPLENYRRMFDDALQQSERKAALTAFRADVRRHVDAIADKYILPGVTADGAVMFLPAEAVFAELHGSHPEVVAYAQSRRVWIVSPTTLMAVLNTARAVLKDVETRRHIHVIQSELAKLAQDFQRFDARMGALARHIEQAGKDVAEVHISSRKISARFQRIEAVRPDGSGEDGGALEAPAATVDVSEAD